MRCDSDYEALKQGAWYDASKSQIVKDFIQRFCRLSHYPWCGSPITLLPWQEELIDGVYGWQCVRDDDIVERLKKRALLFCGKKNGKSTILSSLCLFHVCENPGNLIAVLAGSKDQAGIIFKECVSMINQEPLFKNRFRIRNSKGDMSIRDESTNSEITVHSSQASSSAGFNASHVFLDEVCSWGHSARDVYSHWSKSMAVRQNALLFGISHAGFQMETLGHELFRYTQKVLNNEIIDTELYPSMWTIPDNLDAFDEANWHLANPSLGSTVRKSFLKSEADKAKNNPSERAAFLTLHANQYVGSCDNWIPHNVWLAGSSEDFTPDDFLNEDCVIGADHARTTDLTASMKCWYVDDLYYVWPTFYVPEGKANNLHQKKDLFDYNQEDEKPFITITDGNRHDAKEFIRQIADDNDKFNVLECAYDPSGMDITRQILEDEHGVRMLEVPQTPAHMPELIELTFRVINSGRLRHPNSKCLNWNISNCVPKILGNDKKIMLKKSADKSRIDGAISLCLAVGRMQYYTDSGDLSNLIV
jgi:phage terminase large subunit-like protein